MFVDTPVSQSSSGGQVDEPYGEEEKETDGASLSTTISEAPEIVPWSRALPVVRHERVPIMTAFRQLGVGTGSTSLAERREWTGGHPSFHLPNCPTLITQPR